MKTKITAFIVVVMMAASAGCYAFLTDPIEGHCSDIAYKLARNPGKLEIESIQTFTSSLSELDALAWASGTKYSGPANTKVIGNHYRAGKTVDVIEVFIKRKSNGRRMSLMFCEYKRTHMDTIDLVGITIGSRVTKGRNLDVRSMLLGFKLTTD